MRNIDLLARQIRRDLRALWLETQKLPEPMKRFLGIKPYTQEQVVTMARAHFRAIDNSPEVDEVQKAILQEVLFREFGGPDTLLAIRDVHKDPAVTDRVMKRYSEVMTALWHDSIEMVWRMQRG